jgi:hypothetical protein
MKTEELERQWRDYSSLMPAEDVGMLLSPVEKFCGEPAKLLLPSTNMGTEGPVLKSILVATESFLSEVQAAAKPIHAHFDLIDRRICVRIEVTVHHFVRAQQEGPAISIPFIKFDVTHDIRGSTTATFIGDDWERWLEHAKEIFPVKRLLER